MVWKARDELPDYDGSVPLKNKIFEIIAQQVVLGKPRFKICEILQKAPRYVDSAIHDKPEINKRIAYLTKQAANKTILTKEYVIEGILKISQEAPKFYDKLKAYELLGKTMALFTDKVHISGMPKRIIIRSESGTEQLGSTKNDDNTSPND